MSNTKTFNPTGYPNIPKNTGATGPTGHKCSTRSEKVKIFTEESMGISLPTYPRKLTRKEVEFIIRMNCEELQELLLTVTEKDENVKDLLMSIVEKSNSPLYTMDGKDDITIMAEQADAFVDIDYYNCNAAAKAGLNTDDIFNVVHEANMNKKFPDGTFYRNEIGKVIKPPGWEEGDVLSIINKWIDKGTWSN